MFVSVGLAVCKPDIFAVIVICTHLMEKINTVCLCEPESLKSVSVSKFCGLQAFKFMQLCSVIIHCYIEKISISLTNSYANWERD